MRNKLEQEHYKRNTHRAEYFNKYTDALHFIEEQIIFTDPRFQGYGLQHIPRMDQYANKFFILSGEDSIFVTPTPLPNLLLKYYQYLDLNVCRPENILTPDSKDDVSLAEKINQDIRIKNIISQNQNKFLVPYLLNSSTAQLANSLNLRTLSTPERVDLIADKIRFQQVLNILNEDIQKEFGYKVGINFISTTSDKEEEIRKAYETLSYYGTRNIVLIKPKSASGKGIFFIDHGNGYETLVKTIKEKFEEGEEILLEESVPHTDSPSMQGGRVPYHNYQHFYFGRQDISIKFEHGIGVNSYDSNCVPFNHKEFLVDQKDLEKIVQIHKLISQKTLVENDISGICGLDSVVQIDPDGHISSIKFTEANLHFPGSIAVYAAIRKIYPMGFTGLAFNKRITYSSNCKDFRDFMALNTELLIKSKGLLGIFPIVANYEKAVDVIFFAKDIAHLSALLTKVRS